jgi:tripartite-type tricarboxylate transporter receptor subunit TctC
VAQTYPTRPVRIISAYPAGGVNDIYARLMDQWLTATASSVARLTGQNSLGNARMPGSPNAGPWIRRT